MSTTSMWEDLVIHAFFKISKLGMLLHACNDQNQDCEFKVTLGYNNKTVSKKPKQIEIKS